MYKVSSNGSDWVEIKTLKGNKTNKEIPVNEENLNKHMIELIENQLWYCARFDYHNGICEIAFIRKFEE